jgi:hypothetical protein
MKATSTLFVSALLASLLTACGEKVEEPAVTTDAPAAEAATPAPAAEPAPAPAPEAGGYTPSAEEKVPGITMTQEELDKLFAEARANTPTATVPGEEAPAATPAAEAAPATEAAPAEAAPAEAK